MECTFPVNPCIHLQCITVHCTLKLCALKLRTFTFFPLCKIVWRYDGKKDIYVYVPNYKGAKFDQLHKMSFCCFAPKKWTKEFVFLSWWLKNCTWNLKSKFKFQLFPSRRKTNLSVWFLGEVMARQFCFEIYWATIVDLNW